LLYFYICSVTQSPSLNALFEQDDRYGSDDYHKQDSGDKDVDVGIAEDGGVCDQGGGITCVCECVCVCAYMYVFTVCVVSVCGMHVCVCVRDT